ncbi:tetratricopeptide repeat protein [Flavobacterium sp. ZT3R18]|uniref:tetratricopeptide repeat-containing sensor histidine kinase n=1 Tax=Flavobacterium sp. ZT3R18 TaxID=2594429 RepID=UPI00117AE9B0|nr:sensor histidine kinase [Flavobacterium sp. ZT3R18]TRX36187.1 tetratricopeptide repeat protein [Flavobacterium sp. ZT3R18]
MKAKLKIVLFISLLLLISCQKKKFELEKKDDVLVFFKKTDVKDLDPNTEEKYLDTVCQKMQNQVNDSVTRDLYFKIAVKYFNLNSLDKYFKVTKIVYEQSIQKNDSAHIAKSLCYLGDYYESKTQLDSAFSYYLQSEKMYKKLNDTLNLGKLALYNAGILYDTGNFSEGEIEGIKALRLLSKTKNTRLIYETNVIIALCLKELNSYKEALEYFDMALLQLEQLDKENYSKDIIKKSRASCYNNMGTVYEKSQNYKEAIHLYKMGLQTEKLKQNHPKSYAMLLNNLAYSEMKLGNHNKNVKNRLFESLKIRDSLQVLSCLVASKIRIGEFYLLEKDTVKALSYLNEGLVLAKIIKSNDDVIQSLKLLTENDTKKKCYYSKLYFKVNDSIQIIERKTRNKFARIAYETEQVEEKNEILSKRNTVLLLCLGGLLIVLSGFFVICRLKIKNSQLVFVQSQQEANEKIYQLMLTKQSETEDARKEERKRIAMELHDGIVNGIFTTRFNLMQLNSIEIDKKEQLVQELEKTEKEIRKVSHDLTQNLIFEEEGLPEVLKTLIASQQNQFNTKFDLSIDKYIYWSRVSSSDKIHIYRIIQEAIQNSNKYSKAEKCYIMLLKTADKITIRIWDNGTGFNPKNSINGIGLKNIEERANALKGDLKIISSLGNGTTIEVVF